jgi:hypothetical protein
LKDFSRGLEKLKLRCYFHNEGCKEELNYIDFTDTHKHYLTCNLIKKTCSVCSDIITKSNYASHKLKCKAFNNFNSDNNNISNFDFIQAINSLNNSIVSDVGELKKSNKNCLERMDNISNELKFIKESLVFIVSNINSYNRSAITAELKNEKVEKNNILNNKVDNIIVDDHFSTNDSIYTENKLNNNLNYNLNKEINVNKESRAYTFYKSLNNLDNSLNNTTVRVDLEEDVKDDCKSDNNKSFSKISASEKLKEKLREKIISKSIDKKNLSTIPENNINNLGNKKVTGTDLLYITNEINNFQKNNKHKIEIQEYKDYKQYKEQSKSDVNFPNKEKRNKSNVSERIRETLLDKSMFKKSNNNLIKINQSIEECLERLDNKCQEEFDGLNSRISNLELVFSNENIKKIMLQCIKSFTQIAQNNNTNDGNVNFSNILNTKNTTHYTNATNATNIDSNISHLNNSYLNTSVDDDSMLNNEFILKDTKYNTANQHTQRLLYSESVRKVKLKLSRNNNNNDELSQMNTIKEHYESSNNNEAIKINPSVEANHRNNIKDYNKSTKEVESISPKIVKRMDKTNTLNNNSTTNASKNTSKYIKARVENKLSRNLTSTYNNNNIDTTLQKNKSSTKLNKEEKDKDNNNTNISTNKPLKSNIRSKTPLNIVFNNNLVEGDKSNEDKSIEKVNLSSANNSINNKNPIILSKTIVSRSKSPTLTEQKFSHYYDQQIKNTKDKFPYYYKDSLSFNSGANQSSVSPALFREFALSTFKFQETVLSHFDEINAKLPINLSIELTNQ